MQKGLTNVNHSDRRQKCSFRVSWRMDECWVFVGVYVCVTVGVRMKLQIWLCDWCVIGARKNERMRFSSEYVIAKSFVEDASMQCCKKGNHQFKKRPAERSLTCNCNAWVAQGRIIRRACRKRTDVLEEFYFLDWFLVVICVVNCDLPYRTTFYTDVHLWYKHLQIHLDPTRTTWDISYPSPHTHNPTKTVLVGTPRSPVVWA